MDGVPGPPAGVVVADFSRVLAGPYATMLLGDLGATVVKVEPRSTSRPNAAGRTRSRSRRADVLIENVRSGGLDRSGLGYADVSGTNPGLVVRRRHVKCGRAM